MEDKNLSIEFDKCQTSKRGEIIGEIQLRFRLEIIIIVFQYTYAKQEYSYSFLN